jgi:hypothetical protein
MRALVPMTIAAVLAIAPAVRAQEAPQPVFNIMGPSDCARWPRRASIDSAAKAVPLNWALGFLGGAAEKSDERLFPLIQPEIVSAWMDSYCQDHPTETLPMAARVLAKELSGRLPPLQPPAPMFVPPTAVTPPKPPAPKAAAPARKAPARRAPARTARKPG